MANTYSKVILHIVFAVKNSNSYIPAFYLKRLHAYMGGILKHKGHYPYEIGGTNSHVHILMDYNINQPIPDAVRDIKSATSKHINESHIIPFRFEWQKGYGCFSYSPSQIDAVRGYIKHQYEHHKNISLEQEIKHILDKFGVPYDEKYILKEPSD